MKRLLTALVLVLSLASPALADPAQYATPEAAVDALLKALSDRDREALSAVFGPEADDVVLTGDNKEDREVWTEFLEAYKVLHRIGVEDDGKTATLFIGADQWPFPIDLVKGEDGKWHFDAAAAREEVRFRRIGRNELDVMELLRAYVKVQSRYRQADHDGDGVFEFAGSILSTPGKRDGLYWPPSDDAPESPIGDFVARAAADGYSVGGRDEGPEPYLGYFYRVLDRQGRRAPGGAYKYIINGHMVGGHALIAFPAEYGETGIMTFMVGENGVIYEADLGKNTLERADKIKKFNPGPDWAVAD